MTTIEIERRTGQAAELRFALDGPARLSGHAALFDCLSEDLGGFREKIAPGAFAESLASDDIRALFNHDPNFILGRNRAGTLRLTEDEVGLRIEIDPPDTQACRDLLVSIGRGDVNQMSFGFIVRPNGQTWEKDPEGRVLRTLNSIQLLDVACVVYPAYPETTIAVRSLDAWRDSHQQAEPIGLLRRKLDLALL
jgi:HK97 family phage prohead protease